MLFSIICTWEGKAEATMNGNGMDMEYKEYFHLHPLFSMTIAYKKENKTKTISQQYSLPANILCISLPSPKQCSAVKIMSQIKKPLQNSGEKSMM